MKTSVSLLMHASGDNVNPRDDSVKYMCGMVQRFLEEILLKANRIALYKRKFDAECLLFAVKDDKMFYKAAERRVARKRAVEAEIVYKI